MKPDFDNSSPIYQQIIEMIKVLISKGDYGPGEKVASVRELAVTFGVNPNTVQRALAKLEEMGYLHTERTSGRYVTKDLEAIEQLKSEILARIMNEFITRMQVAGIEGKDIIIYLKAYIERVEEDEPACKG